MNLAKRPCAGGCRKLLTRRLLLACEAGVESHLAVRCELILAKRWHFEFPTSACGPPSHFL
jgi:hypothetical protein